MILKWSRYNCAVLLIWVERVESNHATDFNGPGNCSEQGQTSAEAVMSMHACDWQRLQLALRILQKFHGRPVTDDECNQHAL
jgi:hypothetical protein